MIFLPFSLFSFDPLKYWWIDDIIFLKKDYPVIYTIYYKGESYKLKFRKNISKLLDIEPIRVNIKATTTEKLGFIGRNEGVGVMANANLKYFNWTKG